jgi:hypothetical protein
LNVVCHKGISRFSAGLFLAMAVGDGFIAAATNNDIKADTGTSFNKEDAVVAVGLSKLSAAHRPAGNQRHGLAKTNALPIVAALITAAYG